MALSAFKFFPAMRLRKAREKYRAQPEEKGAVKVAKLLLTLGRGREALRSIKESRRLFPTSSMVNSTYLTVKRHQAKMTLAKTKRSLKRNKSVGDFLKASDLYRTLGEFGKAFDCLKKADQLYPDHWGVHLTRAKVYFSRFREQRGASDSARCLEHLRQARELNPQNYQTLLHLAIVASQLGMLDDANEAVDAILAMVPTDPRALAIRAHNARAEVAAQEAPAAEAPAFDSSSEESAERSTAPITRGETDGESAEIFERLGELEGVKGIFSFRGDGSLAFSSTRPNASFDFSDCIDSVKSMVSSCRFDANNLGVGELQSCALSGADWEVYLRSVEDDFVVLFGEQGPGRDPITVRVDEILTEVPVG